jgi:hypothetical protein
MRKLLTTTAIALGLAMPAGLALPVAAQSQDDSAQQQSADAQTQMQQMGIMASNLIGHRLYMPQGQGDQMDGQQQAAQDGSGQMDGEQQTDMAETEQSDMTQEEQQEVAQGGVEGEAEELEAGTEEAVAEAGQAVEDAAEETGQAIQNVGQEIASEVSEVPENWQMAGDIDDVIITREGEVRALLVDAGGFLGMGETEKRVELDNVRFVRDSDDEGEFFVVFTGDRQMFEEQQDYDQAAAQQDDEMLATQSEEVQNQMAAQGRGAEETREDMEPVDWANVTTEELLGAPVYGENDEWIGDLSELNLADDGGIEGVIIDVGGFLGIGEKPVMMSLDQVTIRRAFGDEIRAYVSATEEELDAMEEWTGTDM